MRKLDIATQISRRVRITERKEVTLLDWILDLFKATLQKGDPIAKPHFGKFTVRAKPPRNGRNPRTGEEFMIVARRAVTFRSSPRLKTEVNAFKVELQDTEGLLSPGQ